MNIRKPCLLALIAVTVFVFSAAIVRIACEAPEFISHCILQRTSAQEFGSLPIVDPRLHKVLLCEPMRGITRESIITYLEKQKNSPPPQASYL